MTDEPRRPAVFRWMLEEDFWRDIFKSVITFIITGSIALTLAVLGGYIKRPDTRAVTLGIMLLVFTVGAIWTIEFIRQVRITKAQGKEVSTFVKVVQYVGGLVILSSVAVLMNFVILK